MSFIKIQLIVDLILIFLISYLFFQNRKRNEALRKISESINEFRSLLGEAKRFSGFLIDEFRKYRDDFENLLSQISDEQKKLKEKEIRILKSYDDKKKISDVLALKNQGLSVEEIAKGLNIPKGEVELILGMIEFLKKKNEK